MTYPFLPYAKQSITLSDQEAIQKGLKEDLITRGPLVQQFEEGVAALCNARFAVAFSSGTAALMAAFFAANLSTNDALYSTPNTFIASVGGAISLGIRPKFIDIDRESGNLDLESLQEELDHNPAHQRIIAVPVHFSGITIDMQALETIIRKAYSEAIIIEDGAHAIGSKYPSGSLVGSCRHSDMTIFSFHPAKMITTGEGGMVTTNDEKLHHRLQLYRDNGIERSSPYLERTGYPGYYEVHAISGNFHLTSFQAALGLSQLTRLAQFIEKRRSIVQSYRKALKGLPHIKLFAEECDEWTAYHLFVVQIDFAALSTTRELLMSSLRESAIGSQLHYIPLYRHPLLQKLYGYDVRLFPKMEEYYREALSLPLYPDLTEEDVQRVVAELRKHILA